MRNMVWCNGRMVSAPCVLSASDEDCGCVIGMGRVVGVSAHILDQAVDAGAGLEEVVDKPINAVLLLTVIHCLGDSVGIEEELSAWMEGDLVFGIRGRTEPERHTGVDIKE